MTEKTVATVAPSTPEVKALVKATSPKKVESKAKNSSAVKPKTHPSAASMVLAAIKTLADRNGSSLQAIKKYITVIYKVDTEKIAIFIKKFLRSAVIDGSLVQVKGKGANGSFKLPVIKPTTAKPKAKAAGEKKGKKPVAKKPVAKKIGEVKTVKKTAVAPKKEVKKPAEKKTAAKAAPKSPKAKTVAAPIAKKVTKAPTAKPKAPIPKKVTAPKVGRPKKAAAAKK